MKRSVTRFRFAFAVISLICWVSNLLGAEGDPHGGLSTEQLNFFEKKIRPVLVDHCYRCHSVTEGTMKGGLALDTKAGVLAGGDSGHAIVPGDVSGGLLIEAIRYSDEDLEMPPKERLPDSVVADFVKWVEMGAPDPRQGDAFETVSRSEIDWDQARQFWAFKAPIKVSPPKDKTGWARTDIDRFVAAKLKDEGLDPVGDTDRRTLVRRLYFDLIGLPPSPAEVDAFLADESADAVKNLVDRLLASERFGERWGRHWLDVARYAESSGKESNFMFPHAWRYRDYVIDAFNADKPFNEFLAEQLAGDLITSRDQDDRNENLTATGFLAIGAKSLNEQSVRQFAMDLADEQIDTMSQAMMGITIACARCHDHKFDPIPTKDYYALAGVFLSTETFYGTPRIQGNRRPSGLLPIFDDSEEVDSSKLRTPSELAFMREQLEGMMRERNEAGREAREARISSTGGDGAANLRRRLLVLNSRIGQLESDLAGVDEFGIPRQQAMGVKDRRFVTDARILIRGEVEKPSDRVGRGFLQILPDGQTEIPQNRSGRKELAEWVTADENPLTARVWANRTWHYLFGRGIVSTVDNFGAMGQKPTHPELLDHLAVSFIEGGWSVKALIKEIVMSRTYQMSSEHQFANFEKDPENKFLWRMSQRRLDAESIRDAMLAVSGNLVKERPSASPVATIGEGNLQRLRFMEPGEEGDSVRSVYLPIVRDFIPEALALFDFAEPSLVTGSRDETTVPSQGVFLMNSDFVAEQAEGLARRLNQSQVKNPQRNLEHAFEIALGRVPTEGEKDSIKAFFQKFKQIAVEEKMSVAASRYLASVSFCQALLASAEFRYLN